MSTSRTVVDASVVVDLLLPLDEARRDAALALLPDTSEPSWAPDVLPFEVFAAARRMVLRHDGPARTARARLTRLRRLPVRLAPSLALIDSAWRLRENAGAADARYLALAQQRERVLLTTDARMARAADALGIAVRTPG
jgi:predicted nucleic acid-binding protein